MVAEGELRTYVSIIAGGEPTTVWWAVNDGGGIEAVEIVAHGPQLRLRAVGPGTFRPDDPTGAGPDLIVGFGDDALSISGPDGVTTTATRAS